ncbi:hypothetical protein [Nocardioides bruguierae]|uniref:hypothetical protein n=1 Tax=Nocardioides bruguierae TaxID=2945102 RepID=UPI00202215F1|nr:hypothetical protein [Nocardioides bruguierae]MCL8027176.1 hypothetical protein [Nocardioides bruguierae]
MNALTLMTLLPLSNPLDPAPEVDDVTAGWVGVLVIVLMFVAVGLLGWSMARQLRKTRVAREAGVYGDQPTPADEHQQDDGSAGASAEPTGPKTD